MPLDRVASASIENLVKIAKAYLPQHITATGKETFSIIYKCRHNDKMTRSECISQVAALVPECCKADLNNPDVVILLEVFKTTCGISCARDYHQNKKFNLHELVRIKNPEAKVKNAESSKATTTEGGPGTEA